MPATLAELAAERENALQDAMIFQSLAEIAMVRWTPNDAGRAPTNPLKMPNGLLVSTERIEEAIARLKQIAARYEARANTIGGISVPVTDAAE